MNRNLNKKLDIEVELPLDDGGKILLLNSLSLALGQRAGNICRLNSEQEMMWHAEISEGLSDEDYFTNIEFIGYGKSECLLGYRVSGFEVRLDVRDGRVLREELVK